MKKFQLILVFLFSFSIFNAWAAAPPLPVEEAFQLTSVIAKDGKIITSWHTAKGYYLYQERFKFKVTGDTHITNIQFPKNFTEKPYPDGKLMHAFSGNFIVTLNLSNNNPATLKITYQGCSEQGICYPPQSITKSTDGTPVSEQSKLVHLLEAKNGYLTLIIFLGLGILLSFTPCILPMLPILSAIIIGQKQLNNKRAFFLSLTYVLAVAVTFAVLGVIAGTLGQNLQATLQKPWIIIGFALIFVAMALSLFGLYTIQLPQGIRQRLTNMNSQQKRGTYLGAAVMGCLSVLIASPCITPPLAAAVIYLANQGDILTSTLALFSMGLGIGIPLLIIGTFGSRLLPKAGRWMNGVKYLFGILLIGVAIWMVARILPPQITQVFKPTAQTENTLGFKTVHTLAEIKTELKSAQRPVMLDFYADWCATCHEIDANVFSNTEVKEQLKPYLLLRVDVTKNTQEDQTIQRYFQVIAPPTLLFFNPQGKEISSSRVVGDISAKKFLILLENNIKEMINR